MSIAYEELGSTFDASGAAAGLEGLVSQLQYGHDHHALFRAMLLKKRFEMNLPLINPGDLKGFPEEKRKEYEAYVETVCREIGHKYLNDSDIPQAFRYFRTIGDLKPIRDAIEKVDGRHVSEEVLNIAIEDGVDPRRGFELTLEGYGLCRAITVFESEFSVHLDDKKFAAALLVRALYKELVHGVSRSIMERFGELPPEKDLVELIRLRPWLFENGATHADPHHVGAVSRIGLIVETPADLIMSLSISEYGRMLSPEHQPNPRAPFEAGFTDHARFARALLGQNVDETIEHFRKKLAVYVVGSVDRLAPEMVVMLLWRTGKKEEALEVWQQYLSDQPPELPGLYIPSFYDLCLEAKSYHRLAEAAKNQGDSAVWGAARTLEASKGTLAAQPAATEQPS